MAGFLLPLNGGIMIFDIENSKVILKASSLAIPEFKKIWDNDKDKLKKNAYNKLSYVVFLCDMSLDNPYRNYADQDREITLKRDFFHDENINVEEDISDAIRKYRELQETVSVRMLRAAKKAADKLSEYFETINFKEVDKMGKPVYSARDVASNLKEIGGIVKSLSILEDQVRREQATGGKIRGGGEIGDYEVKDKTFDYGQLDE
jgi:hypothetical protein